MMRLEYSGERTFSWLPKTGAWMLGNRASGQGSIPIHRTPFLIGRAMDCELVLPDSPELRKSTSRWHCRIMNKGGKLVVADGSLRPVPATGKRKASISGTYLNGRKLRAEEQLKAGDLLKAGPWEFALALDAAKDVAIDDFLTRMADEKPRRPDPDEAGAGFGIMHDLFAELNQADSTDEALALILRFAIRHIKSAEVAAVLLDDAKPGPGARIAWQRDTGRIMGLKLSKGLLADFSPDNAFLLQCDIQRRTESQQAEDISSGLLVPVPGQKGRIGVLYMDNRYCGKAFSEEDLYLANALAGVVSLQLGFERQAFLDNVERSMSRYFGPDVVRMIVEHARKGKAVGLDVREAEMTVAFVDMAGFSAFSRDRSPQDVVRLLNPYFELASRCVVEHGGHVDKFIGDAVMAVFGGRPFTGMAARPPENHAVQAVRAAKGLLRQWGEGKASPWGKNLKLRVGINTGKVVIGNVGFPDRMEYSAIGDTVNLASRLEKLAPPEGIAVSEATYKLLGGEFNAGEPQDVPVKGIGRVRVRIIR